MAERFPNPNCADAPPPANDDDPPRPDRGWRRAYEVAMDIVKSLKVKEERDRG